MAGKRAFEDTKELLEKHNQGQLLQFWPELSAAERESLLGQIAELDFDKIDDWVANHVVKTAPDSLPEDFVPAASYPSEPADARLRGKYARAAELGEKLISAGKVAAFVVAGGQGTRLGFDGPKGDFPISPVKTKTLFQIFAQTCAAAARKYRTTCPWYIMTSPPNHRETTEIFRSNDFYGLSQEDVFIFQQGTMPNFSIDGKILMADKATIARSPDGHGGSLKALYETGALDDMKRRGVEVISYWQVDNPLVNIFDPLFIGLHVLDQAEMSSKAVLKTDPYENVGNFLEIGDKVTVVEYIEFYKLGRDVVEKKNPDGSLVFKLGSIAIHMISTSFVERLNTGGFSLPLHKAKKKIPHIDSSGNRVEPTEPNGVKLETFIFDALPLAEKSIILEIVRTQEFAPTKNARGVDSVDTTKKLMAARAVDWLEAAGIAIPRRPDGSPDCLIEISPSFALHKDDVKARADNIPPIRPGDQVYLD